jgi:formylglycine-generating enzyme required for sulfatase activity
MWTRIVVPVEKNWHPTDGPRPRGAKAVIDESTAARLSAVVGDGEFAEFAGAAHGAPEDSATTTAALIRRNTPAAAIAVATLACLWVGNRMNHSLPDTVAHAGADSGSFGEPTAAAGPMFGAGRNPSARGGDPAMNLKNSARVAVLAVTAAVTANGALAGDAVQWRVEDGGNGHWYRGITTALTQQQAISLASSQGGHLATITTDAENQFLAALNLPSSGGSISYWTGGIRANAGSGSWSWITGEDWNYSNFDVSEPNGCCGADVRFTTFRTYDVQQGKWDDTSSENLQFVLLEWSSDCNSDGIVDFGQILAGTLDDANTNGVPDRCECATNPGLLSCCLGDIVNDRTVNGADLGTLLAYWGPVTSGAFSIASDLNNDGDIDGSDLGILLAYWGACPTANVPVWATLIEAMPDPAVVTDPALRTAIAATGLAWRVRDTATQIEMLLAPPGTFQMGCTASNLSGCNDDENPTHSVTLTQAFYLGRYELTQGQWVAKLVSNPSSFQGYPDSVNRPVEQVTWSAAQDYVRVTGMRLPSEAEWEFACRAGTTTAFNNGSNADSTAANVAWYVENSGGQTHAVGNKAANALGFYDMTGNVWEWVNDWYDSSYYSMSPSTNPGGPVSGTTRVLRGGSWYYDSGKVRSSYRSTYGGTGVDFGFRVARNP